MGSQRQEDRDEQTCHIWRDFSVEVHHLSAGGEDRDQGVSQRVEVDATPSSPVGSASKDTSTEVTLGGVHDTKGDAEQVEDIVVDVELFAAIGTKVKLRLWGKKHESHKLVIVTS